MCEPFAAGFSAALGASHFPTGEPYAMLCVGDGLRRKAPERVVGASGSTGRRHVLPLDDFDAAIFDLDGVITRTARVHAQSWKRLFDDFLRLRADETGEPFRPFDVATDYTGYVDGKPRFEGVESFLKSRGIALPWGEPDDGDDKATIYGLGNRKNRYFHEYLERDGVEVFDSSKRFVKALRGGGVKTALVSSSRNARAVLEAAGLTELFDTCIDGNDLADLGLKGKPAPDLFLLAAERLGTSPARAMVVEDAISGVEAGRAGHFRRVIGVDRRGHPEQLQGAGADIVVADLAFLELQMTRPARRGVARAK